MTTELFLVLFLAFWCFAQGFLVGYYVVHRKIQDQLHYSRGKLDAYQEIGLKMDESEDEGK